MAQTPQDQRGPRAISPSRESSSIDPITRIYTLLSFGRFDTCRRSTLSCWRRTRISASSLALDLKSKAKMWRIS